mmetsp:Transcript_3617/g.6241  ORF Transcript_3617/g.6241 Transcript_3617/m.6241 type:complete len:85 (-) Transcript_3617:2874-3128(-)
MYLTTYRGSDNQQTYTYITLDRDKFWKFNVLTAFIIIEFFTKSNNLLFFSNSLIVAMSFLTTSSSWCSKMTLPTLVTRSTVCST